jgi:hypothetical protein
LKNYAEQKSQERLFQEYKESKIKERLNWERAIFHHKIRLQRKYFTGIKKWYLEIAEEKRIEQEHEEKLSNFLQNMKK